MTQNNKKEKWVYKYDKNYPCEYEITKVRYVLGEEFKPSIEKALVCIGVNPSTAIPKRLDATLKRIQDYAKGKYDAWYMLNIYPQRATNPNEMDKEINKDIHSKNLEHIQKLMTNLPSADIWCAWGANVARKDKPYLKECLKEIKDTVDNIEKMENKSFNYVSEKRKGKIDKEIMVDGKLKHPLHPISSVEKEKGLSEFKIEKYLENL